MLKDVQRLLFTALTAEEPQKTLRDGLAAEKNLTEQERGWLETLTKDDGFLLSSLIVKKLRFERLQLSDKEMKELFEREPERFVQLFREYTAKVAPTEYFPSEEGKMFREWKGNLDRE